MQQDDHAERLAWARNTLRKSLVAGAAAGECETAIETLASLADADTDTALAFEAKRWRTTLTLLRAGG